MKRLKQKASTLLLPSKYNIHIRLHCPLAIAQKYDYQKPNQQEFSNELRVIHKAKMVSSPSYALVKELSDEIRTDKVTFFKNPINIDNEDKFEKEFDIVFMGRFQELKGTKDINKILERLPENYKALLIGPKSNLFKVSPNVKCSVEKKGEITGNKRFEYIKKSKCLMMPSQFENCSMVILETLSCHVPVVCWDVGGNSEIATSSVLNCAKFGDYDDFSHKIKSFVTSYPGESVFVEAVKRINADFTNGIKNLINEIANENPIIYRGMNNKEQHSYCTESVESYITPSSKLRVFGVAFSNEHIEELWAPVIDRLGYEYRYVSRRELGHHTVFKHPAYEINKKWFCQFDWIKDTDRLLKQIQNYRPNFILFHNGLHPIYKDALEKIKDLKIPIIYSELGWFPQKDHIYFDKWGTNGQSYIASMTAEQLCKKTFRHNNESHEVTGEYALIVTQLENDTNLIVNSPRFKNNINFLKHVISKIPSGTKIIIKPHPLDKNVERYEFLENEKIKLVTDTSTDILLKNAHSLIGINSTVLLQALKFDVNIYAYGRSILDNKGVAIDCTEISIDKRWTNAMLGSRQKRDAIVESLMDHQINLIEIRNGNNPSQTAALPLIENCIYDFTHLINRKIETTKRPTSIIINEEVTKTAPKPKKRSKVNKIKN
ncbi:capsular polysaccharide export protein, LipB/KpsS family [Type-E symbiont of Plautia stali]|uniref:capsular polysaccharide export protein, LipB/KpsS family n=1 Tax=Type-E symbiont of Plautia stali TaxID=1560357 RepID=UPI00128EE424|nr:glycosyltransferase [Type-E symbiont of Plautia stali]